MPQTLMPSLWNKTAPVLTGMQRIDLTNKKTMRKVSALCKLQHILNPPLRFIKSNLHHYGK